MESLLLFRRALSSPTMCRFIPALSVPERFPKGFPKGLSSGSQMTDQLLQSVQSRYAAVANSTLSNKNAGVKAVAEAFGYGSEELSSIPAEANMGLSCGDPTAIASIRPGEVVVDLGSGGGLDVFLGLSAGGSERPRGWYRHDSRDD
jgi:hypothetical protein